MKKIAFITPMLQPYRISFYTKIAESLPDLDFMFFHGLNNEASRPAYQGQVSFKTESYHPKLINLGPFGLYYNKGLINKVKNYNPDVLILFGNPGVVSNQLLVRWAKTKGIKICFWVCSWDSHTAKGILKEIKNFITRRYFKKADHFIAYSSHAQKFIKKLIGEKDNVSIAYNGLDISESLARYEQVVEEGLVLRNTLEKSSFLFLYVGGLIPTKNPVFLINAFNKLLKKYKDAHLWIIGDGIERDKILNLMKNNRNIKYFGRISEGVDKYFKAADCVVLPGSGGLALNQAMFWKTPCISSFADGTEQDLIIDNVTGYLFKTNDEKSLIENMEKMVLMDNDTRKIMGQKSHDLIISQSNTEAMSRVFIKAINELL